MTIGSRLTGYRQIVNRWNNFIKSGMRRIQALVLPVERRVGGKQKWFLEKFGEIFGSSKNLRNFATLLANMVSIAQLVRASDCGSEGRGFDPHCSPHQIFTPDSNRFRRFFIFHTHPYHV